MMKKKWKWIAALAAVLSLGLAACGGGDKDDPTGDAIKTEASARQTYVPKNDVEFNNFNEAQKLYDDPSTIIWCTMFPDNPSAPFVTVPIAGKLTSSSTSVRRPEEFIDRGNYSWQTATAASVDGLYHPNPPAYRYGFTPGGQYVDLFNMTTVCTTQPLKFQKESVALAPDAALTDADSKAQEALRAGQDASGQISPEAEAQASAILKQAVGQ